MPTAAGASILEARVVMPARGAWTADLAIDSDQGPAAVGPIVIDLGGLTLHGVAIQGGAYAGATQLRVVGGAGGLSQVLEPKDYRGVPLRIPLEDALQLAGETLSGTADATALAYTLTRWVRFRQSAGELLGALADEVGATWRVLADGTVWLGTDAFLEAQVEHELLDGDPHLDLVEVGVETPTLVPGVAFLGRSVVQVEHVLAEDRVRSVVTFG